MTFIHQFMIVIGFAILFLAAAPILASAAVGLAQWLTL